MIRPDKNVLLSITITVSEHQTSRIMEVEKMSGIYAARSLVVYRVWFNLLRDTKKTIDPTDLDGNDILDLFDEFCTTNVCPSQIETSERFIRFESCDRHQNHILVKFDSGRAGLHVSVLDTNTMQESGISYGEDMAGMVGSRMLLRRTRGLGYALVCIESVPNGGGVTAPLTMFRKFVRTRNLGVTMRFEHVQETEAIKAFSGIEEIELKRYARPDDVSNPTVINAGPITHRIGHKSRRLMPLELMKEFLLDRRAVAEYVGVEAEYSGREELYVTLRKIGGGSRKFMMGKDLAIPVREVLNESGVQPLSDNEFVAHAIDSCQRLEDTLDRII